MVWKKLYMICVSIPWLKDYNIPVEHYYLQVFINFKIEINKSVPEKENLRES